MMPTHTARYLRIVHTLSTCLGTIALLLLIQNLALAGDITIDSPKNGWRYNDSEKSGFRQEVHYPAASVNAEGHEAMALIAGHIAHASKDGKPHTLIVNGLAMPLLTDEDGSFARPYAFGNGANNVEIRSPQGTKKRVQFYEARQSRTESRLKVLLAWDTNATDLDLHVVSPDGQHVFYGDRVSENGGALDVDVTTGYGPEIYAAPNPPHGVYHVYVNYYGTGEQRDIITVARVTIITNEHTPNEKRQMFSIPMRKPGELTLVKSFVW